VQNTVGTRTIDHHLRSMVTTSFPGIGFADEVNELMHAGALALSASGDPLDE
jgi:hypothetical protein